MSIRAQLEGGRCPARCGNRIHKGDLIERVNGEWRHVECAYKPQADPICGSCWRETPCRCIE